eukprot:8248184-Pyramimonas_sp.AAC.1
MEKALLCKCVWLPGVRRASAASRGPWPPHRRPEHVYITTAGLCFSVMGLFRGPGTTSGWCG